MTLSFHGVKQGEWKPDAPEYDHKDPEYDGPYGRRSRTPAPSYDQQTQIGPKLGRHESAQEFDPADG